MFKGQIKFWNKLLFNYYKTTAPQKKKNCCVLAVKLAARKTVCCCSCCYSCEIRAKGEREREKMLESCYLITSNVDEGCDNF